MFRRHRRSIFVSLFLLSSVLIVGPAAAQSCSAKVRADGVALAFGGWDTTSVTASRLGTGHYQVICNGVYTLTPTEAYHTYLSSTAESAQYGVSNARVLSANANQIIFEVWTWISSNSTPVDNNFYVIVHTS